MESPKLKNVFDILKPIDEGLLAQLDQIFNEIKAEIGEINLDSDEIKRAVEMDILKKSMHRLKLEQAEVLKVGNNALLAMQKKFDALDDETIRLKQEIVRLEEELETAPIKGYLDSMTQGGINNQLD